MVDSYLASWCLSRSPLHVLLCGGQGAGSNAGNLSCKIISCWFVKVEVLSLVQKLYMTSMLHAFPLQILLMFHC